MITRKHDKDLAQLLDGFPSPVFLVDSTTKILFANRACAELSRGSAPVFEGQHLCEFLEQDSGEEIDWSFSQATTEKCFALEATLYPQCGDSISVEVVAQLIELKKSRMLMVCVSDATEKILAKQSLSQLENKMIHADRVEMAGTIAGQVAHDFKNLLSPVLGLPEFIKGSLPEESKAYQDLMVIQSSGQRMADITQQLLTLARRGFHEHKELNVNDVISESLQHLGSRKANGINLELNLDDSLPAVKGEFTQLMRAVFNLLLNAMEAIGEEGLLTVMTDHGTSSRAHAIDERDGKPAEFVRIVIQDTGMGIPEDQIEEIFRPFYTTKKTEKNPGSGIGLSVVQGVVMDHGGTVEVESRIGKGTTFTIYLPLFS